MDHRDVSMLSLQVPKYIPNVIINRHDRLGSIVHTVFKRGPFSSEESKLSLRKYMLGHDSVHYTRMAAQRGELNRD